MNEFELIRDYFGTLPVRDDVITGVGDDAAVLALPADEQLVISTDTLIAGVHFPVDTDPYSIGWKSLAVNLSDLAAMGAAPAWFTLNLTLPVADPGWLEKFSAGLFALARTHHIELIGGDTTRGPLSITITVNGFVPSSAALLRTGARPGDCIYVTGTLGDAALGLRYRQRELSLVGEFGDSALARLDRPIPRVTEGERLRGIASACIDISDGLVADLGHILEQSEVGATVELAELPLSPAYRSVFAEVGGFEAVLTNGDDYELCFTVPAARTPALEKAASHFGCSVSQIGVIEAEQGLRLGGPQGALHIPHAGGYDHFR